MLHSSLLHSFVGLRPPPPPPHSHPSLAAHPITRFARAQLSQKGGRFDPGKGGDFAADTGLAESIDKYYRELDVKNARCRWYSKICSLLFLVFIVAFTLIYLVIVRRGYQKVDPIIGNVQIRVRGVVKQSPAPALKEAAVYDAADLVLPSKERNAVFVATNIFTSDAQMRFDAGKKEHMKCADIRPCPSCDVNKACPDECGDVGEYSSNGMFTGICIDIAPEGGGNKPNKRCEVKAWCPVAEINRIQKKDYQPDEESTGVVQFDDVHALKLDIHVNARSEVFDRKIQHKATMQLGKLLQEAKTEFEATKDSGAIIYAQVRLAHTRACAKSAPTRAHTHSAQSTVHSADARMHARASTHRQCTRASAACRILCRPANGMLPQ